MSKNLFAMPQLEMVSKRKLAEALYFLAGLKDEQNPETLNFKLSAFLNACHGVMDIIIYDFAEMRGLGITRDDRLDRSSFQLVAKSHNVKQELTFSKWINEKLDELSQKKPLWNLRNIYMHRDYPELSQEVVSYSVSTYSSVDIGDPRYVAAISHSGTINVIGPPHLGGSVTQVKTKIVLKLKLREAGSREVEREAEEVCRELYEELVKIVGEAEKRFWDV